MTRHALSGVSVSSECGGYRSSPHITITPISFSYLPMINSSLTHLSILLGANDVEHGVFLDSGGDVDTEVIAVGSPPTEVRRTGNGRILPAADGNSNEDGTSAYYWMSGSLDVEGKTPFTTGTYITEGNLFTITSEALTNPNAGFAQCPDDPATYPWTFDGQILTFRVIGEDKCWDRQRTYERHYAWRRAE